MVESRGQEELHALLKEAELVYQAERGLFVFSERILALGLSLVSLGATVGIVREHQEVLIALPFAVLGLVGYGFHLAIELLYLGGYRSYLEDRINELLGSPALKWDSLVVPVYRRFPNLDGGLVLGVIIGVFAVTSVLAFRAAQAINMSAGWWIGLSLLLGAVIVVLIGTVVRIGDASERARSLAERGRP